MFIKERQKILGIWSPLFLLGMALFAGPIFEFVPEMMWHDRQRIVQIVLLLVIAFLAASVWRQALLNTFLNFSTPVRYALGIGFALGGISVWFSALPRFGSLEWATFLLLLSVAFLLADQARHEKGQFDTWAMRWVLIVSVVILLRTMMGYLAAMIEGLQLDTMALFLTSFSNRRVFGQVASMVIPLLAYPVLQRGTPRVQRWAIFVLLAAWWMLVLASGSRGAWLALGVTSVILSIFAWRNSMSWLRVQGLALGAGAILFALLFVWLPTWLGMDAALENRFSNITHLSNREELWSLAWNQIQSHPWLGIGPMHLASIPMEWGAHPHNAILQLGAEWGVPAALAFILTAIYGLMRLLLYLRHSPHSLLLICLTASLLSACVQSMVDGVIVIPYTQIWVVFVAGWALGLYSRNAVPNYAVNNFSRVTCWGVSAIFLLTVTLLLSGIYPEVFNRVEATRSYIKKAISEGKQNLPPRYWAVGPIHK